MVNIKKGKLNLSLSSVLLFCMGMFSTMPILSIKVTGRYFSFFTIFFAISLIYLLSQIILNGRIPKTNKIRTSLILVLWLCAAIISSLCGWVYFSNNSLWQTASVSYISKIIIYIIFAFCWICQKNIPINTSYLISGLLFGCIANLIWATIDGFGYYLFNISINNAIFQNYGIDNNIRDGALSIIQGGLIRTPGFNYDPAHMGFIVPAMVAYSIRNHKNGLFILCMMALICSASTTALVCTVIIILINFKYVRINILKQKKFFLYAFVLVFLIVVISIFNKNSFISNAIGKFFNRINNTYINLSKDDLRFIYLTEFFNALITAGPMILIGTGFGTASYAYVFNESIFIRLGAENYFPYDMEMTYIAYLFDVGIVGLLIYCFIIFKIYSHVSKSTSKNDLIIYSLIIGMIFSGLFYHYTLMAMQILILVVGASCIDMKKKKILKKQKLILQMVKC